MEHHIRISEASTEDIDALNELINSAYRGDTSRKGWTTEANLIDGRRVDPQTLQQYFDDESASILKASDDAGSLVGCVYLKRQTGKLYLGMLTVSPLLQSRGTGSCYYRPLKLMPAVGI